MLKKREDVNRYTNHYYHCGTPWDDNWSCMCNDECPVCKGEIEPYASTDNEDGDYVVHNEDVAKLAGEWADEFVCSACDEINILEPGQDIKTRECEDCKQIGTLITFAEHDKLRAKKLGEK